MKVNRSFLILCALIVAVTVYVNFLGMVRPVSLVHRLDGFPRQIADFKRVSVQSFSDKILNVAGVDNYIMWQYQNPGGYTLGLYIGYYRDQTEGSIIHSPKHCMPGSGWEPILTKEVPLLDVNGRTYAINRMVLQKGMERQIAHYWYQGRGRVLANEYIDRALMIWDSITRHRSDGSLVRIIGPGNERQADIKIQMRFMAALMPELDKFLPR